MVSGENSRLFVNAVPLRFARTPPRRKSCTDGYPEFDTKSTISSNLGLYGQLNQPTFLSYPVAKAVNPRFGLGWEASIRSTM